MKPEQIKQAAREYKEIYLKECGVDLSEEEATRQATSLLGFFEVLTQSDAEGHLVTMGGKK